MKIITTGNLYKIFKENDEDTIISLVLLWYIWKSEVLKIGAWTRRKRNGER